MSRSVFGWNLPPGCTLRHIEEAYGDEGPCECCGHDPADCICPECPTCGSTGDQNCYKDNDGHGLRYNREQLTGQTRMRIVDLRFQLQEEEANLKFLEDGGEIEQ